MSAVSIPIGSIKTRFAKVGEIIASQVSIPIGSIKTIIGSAIGVAGNLFQFQLVRLKLLSSLILLLALAGFNSNWFD